ncbi:MAG TPA: glycoside hydrolase family 30 beta sandwich domain-containing protein [Phnomibacter sp.]|nr:glycoside hydrolase family 30 beta sandwich domain-containing protein [Phnomibacter sp.]
MTQNQLPFIRAVAPYILSVFIVCVAACSCNKSTGGDSPDPVTPPANNSDITAYVTFPGQSIFFKKQTTALNFSTASPAYQTIDVDASNTYQTIDGFGYTLTGGSASLLHALPDDKEAAVLKELFATDQDNIGVSYLRISIGASDLSAAPFSYNDIPTSETDFELKRFSIDKEKADLIPVLKQINQLSPGIKILGSPWSAPEWMKTNKAFKGGSLRTDCYAVYAQYFVKYIQAMKAEGITLDAITIQNEPFHGGNNPSMLMSAAEQADFIKNHLGPAFTANNIATKIIIYDHNLDRPDYPIAVLSDPGANKYIDGSAFHLYGGAITALTDVHNAFPNKHVYFTEQWVGGPGNFASDLIWHTENLIIGATRNWSRNVLEWNLAADPNYDPHTDGGCNTCLGALTIGSTVSKNVSYYIIAHASKFVRPGSTRIASNNTSALLSVAFKNPAGQTVLIVLNKSAGAESFCIRMNNKTATTSIGAGAVATYVW